MIRGKLEKWIASGGYGFIRPASGERSVFVHDRVLQRCGVSLHALTEARAVDFEVESDREGRPRVAWLALVEPGVQP
jgi:cold shock protein